MTLVNNIAFAHTRLIETGSAPATTAPTTAKKEDDYSKMIKMLKKPVKLFPLRKPRKGSLSIPSNGRN